MSIGSQIKYYREKSGMLQTDLGEALGVSAQAVSKWERDKAEPDSSTIRKMCEIFGIDANAIYEQQESRLQETLYRRPGMRVLFDAVRDAPDEVLQQTIDIIEVLKNGKKK